MRDALPKMVFLAKWLSVLPKRARLIQSFSLAVCGRIFTHLVV